MRRHDAYVVCTTPRSGSTLLCSLLAATGRAGRPGSHFHGPSVDGWVRSFGLAVDPAASRRDTLARIVAAAVERGRGGTDLFGLRLQHHGLDVLLRQLAVLHPDVVGDADRMRAAFGRTLFVHLTRADRIGQAVSHVRAEQTGLWHRAADGTELERLGPPAPPRYDPEAIRSRLGEALAGDRRWAAWFATEGIVPVTVTYESLSARPAEVLADLLEHLGLERTMAEGVEPGVGKLADETSRRWVERFRANVSRSRRSRAARSGSAR